MGFLFSVDADMSDTHTYSIGCSVTGADDSHFQISGNSLQVATVFDFENPMDANLDGIYDVCIKTSDDKGGTFDELFSITVVDDGLVDTDSDGAEDTVDDDDDDDGLLDSEEASLGLDSLLVDSDGDGIDDATEVGDNLSLPSNFDMDGQIDALDSDSDNDGISDLDEGNRDTDGDGSPNYIDLNSDGDAIDDVVEGDGDGDSDFIPNYLDSNDTDGLEGDEDGDGLTNLEEHHFGTDPLLVDTDGDGTPDGDEVSDPGPIVLFAIENQYQFENSVEKTETQRMFIGQKGIKEESELETNEVLDEEVLSSFEDDDSEYNYDEANLGCDASTGSSSASFMALFVLFFAARFRKTRHYQK